MAGTTGQIFGKLLARSIATFALMGAAAVPALAQNKETVVVCQTLEPPIFLKASSGSTGVRRSYHVWPRTGAPATAG